MITTRAVLRKMCEVFLSYFKPNNPSFNAFNAFSLYCFSTSTDTLFVLPPQETIRTGTSLNASNIFFNTPFCSVIFWPTIQIIV